MKAESYPVVYLEPCFIEEEDLSKAIEAQGVILIAIIERTLDGKLDDTDRAEVSDLLDGLTSLVVVQGSPFRSDQDINTYSDGTPIVRMEPTCLETAPSLPDVTEIAKGFEYLGEFAEHLVKIPRFQVVVNEPPQRHARHTLRAPLLAELCPVVDEERR
jgi:hypothetical protein